jgi:hypothetical protein
MVVARIFLNDIPVDMWDQLELPDDHSWTVPKLRLNLHATSKTGTSIDQYLDNFSLNRIQLWLERELWSIFI